MTKKIFTDINIYNGGVDMKTIFESDNSTAFNARQKNILVKKKKQITAAVTAGIATLGLSAKRGGNTRCDELELSERENKIKSKIQEHIDNKKTLTVKNIAKELNIPIHLVVTSLYRTKSNLRSFFDKVKNTAYMKKPTSDTNKNAAQEMTNLSKNFLTDGKIYPFEADYSDKLGRKLDQINMSKEEIDELKILYTTKPALADSILFSRSKSKKSGAVTANTLRAISTAHNINPELTEALVHTKKADGKFYSLREIVKIVKLNQISSSLLEPAKNDVTFIYSLANTKMKNGSPRFGANDILQIIKSMEKEPNFTNLVMNQKNGFIDYRFNGYQLRLILQAYDKYPHIVSHLINSQNVISPSQIEYKYPANCIEKILEILDGNDVDIAKKIIDIIRNEGSYYKNDSISSVIINTIEEYKTIEKSAL